MRGHALIWRGGAGLAVVAACQGAPRMDGGKAVPLDDCPKVWAEALAGPGATQNVPEFHDCQRFIVDDATEGPSYGGMFAIFATYRPAQEEGAGSAATTSSATIWAKDASYDSLHIEQGYNCLHLFKVDGSWQARMVPHGKPPTPPDCGAPVDPATVGGHPLTVIVDAGAEPGPVPPVARWDWDMANRQQYIGIYCGDAWCEVGNRTSLIPSQRYLGRRPDAHELPPGRRRVYGGKGWYDEQYLATPLTPGGRLRPTGLLATIIPNDALGSRDTAAFRNTWVETAEVALHGTGPAEAYEKKLNIARTGPRGPLNKIQLCHGPDCLAEADPSVRDRLRARADTMEQPHWYARIIRSTNGNTMYAVVERCDLSAAPYDVPATARWRWTPNDETTWMRCAKGCCEIIEPGE